ncbi:hypothetical protein MJD09_21410 [bacterium]|nr:hypothetical protein [bacterium]
MREYLLALTLFLLGCEKPQQETNQTANTPSPNSDPTLAISWTSPPAWTIETPTSSFRKAQFRLLRTQDDPEDATCIVFHFGGEGGGVQANLDRWASQFTQPDGSASLEAAKTERVTVNGLKQTRLDLSGTYLFKTTPMSPHHTEKPNFRMLAAVVESSSGPWFVKLVGPVATVSKWEQSYKQFMDSFQD